MVSASPLFFGGNISQFSGRAILIGPRSSSWKFELGITSSSGTRLIVGVAVLAGDGFERANPWDEKTAPFFLLAGSHCPDLAPWAISSAVYDFSPEACWRTFANSGESPTYF